MTDKTKDDTGTTEETITLTRAELDAALADRDKRANMSDDEKRVRSIVSDEVRSTLRDELPKALSSIFTDDDGDGDDADRSQDTGGGGGSKLGDKISDFLGIKS